MSSRTRELKYFLAQLKNSDSDAGRGRSATGYVLNILPKTLVENLPVKLLYYTLQNSKTASHTDAVILLQGSTA